jgi:MerR family transcriptional regulator, light-induced transcriptional regulator
MTHRLGIAEVAARTGVPAPVLRAWESRFGFPSPERLPNGRRRYDERDVELLRQVTHEREAGLSLKAAVERARSTPQSHPGSIFASVRGHRADLDPRLLSKRTLMHLSRAIEDEFRARGEAGVMIATFQREIFYRQAERRWRDLARTAELAIVFADFGRRRDPPSGPVELPLAGSEPVAREWSLICDCPRFAACLVGWEVSGQGDRPDAERRFETLWSIEPELVRRAGNGAREIVRRAAPELADRFPSRFAQMPPPSGADVHALAALTRRMISYAEGAGAGARRSSAAASRR